MKWKHNFHLHQNTFSASGGEGQALGDIQLDVTKEPPGASSHQRELRREDWTQIDLSKKLAHQLLIKTGFKPLGLERISLIHFSPLVS